MLLSERADIEVRKVSLRNPAKVVSARGRQTTLTPVVHGGDASVGKAGYSRSASHGVQQFVSESVHGPLNAETAYSMQAIVCRNGICHSGIDLRLLMPMNLETIKALMKERGFNQGDLANLLGLDPSAVSRRMTGGRPFKLVEMQRIEGWLGVEPSPAVEIGSPVRMIPVIGQVAAGSWREAIQQPLGAMPVPHDTPKNVIALRVDGDSMDLEIDHGGVVIVDLDDRALYPGRLYVILNGEGDATFKQFASDPARLEPRSTNPAHRTIQIGDGEGFSILGRVTALYRNR